MQKVPTSLSDSSKPISHQRSQMKEGSFAITRTACHVLVSFVFIHDVIPSHSREFRLLQYTSQLRIPWVDELKRFELCFVPYPVHIDHNQLLDLVASKKRNVVPRIGPSI